jgi:hypothetical protein
MIPFLPKRLFPWHALLRVLLALLLGLAAIHLRPPPVAHAATITVCTSGCDYATITEAIANANDGDIVDVQYATHSRRGQP